MSLEIIPIYIKKQVQSDEDIVKLLLATNPNLQNKDILIITQKIISKQERQKIKLDTITPTELAIGIAKAYNKDSRLVQIILDESKRIVKMRNGILITETKHGIICANSGVDQSNVSAGFVTLLPVDPDRSAQKIRLRIKQELKIDVAVLISDTFGRPLRTGQTDCVIGMSGIGPLNDYTGKLDSIGNVLNVTSIAVGDELCGAAELSLKKSTNCPMAIIRGYDFKLKDTSAKVLVRQYEQNLFT